MPIYFPPLRMQISGNTAGATALVSSGTLTLAGGNNITLSQNGNAITISGGAGGAGGAALGISDIGNTAGTSGTFSSGTVVLAGGNNITLSQSTNANGATITVSAGAGGGFLAGVSNLGNTAGSTGTVNAQVVIVGGNNITLSQSTAVGNSATISIIGPQAISVFEPYPFHNTGTGVVSLQTNTSGAMSLYRFIVNEPVAAELVGMVFSASFATTTATQAFTQSGTLQWGIYSNPTGTNNTVLSMLGSNSFLYSVTHSSGSYTFNHPTTTNAGGGYSTGNTNSAGANITSGYTGLKLMLLGLNSTLMPGDYWIGIYHRNSTAGANAGIRFSLYGNTQTLTGLAPLGSFSSAYSTGTNIPTALGGNWQNAQGSYTLAALTSLAATVTMSQITQNVGLVPYMKFVTRV